jgi:hypothetical protein
MTTITTQGGKIVLRDGRVGTEQGCCCEGDATCEECVNNSLPADCELCNDLYPLSTNAYNAEIAAGFPPCGYDSGLTGAALFAAMDDACSGYSPPVYCYVCEDGGYWVQISGCGCTGSCKRCYGTPCSNACSAQNFPDCFCDSVLTENPECGDTVEGVCCGAPNLCS